MVEIAPNYSVTDEKKLSNAIQVWLWSNFYSEVLHILNPETVLNDKNILLNAIRTGLIYYQNGAFYSSKNTFSLAISKELRAIGAKYSKTRKAYVLAKNKLDNELLWAIQTNNARTVAKSLAIKTFLDTQLSNINELIKKLHIPELIEGFMQNLQKRTYALAQKKKIELISPKLTDFRANAVYKNYVESLDYNIKGWVQSDITKMRETVSQMALEGKGIKTIADYIQGRYGVDQKKALFLARNENAIATSEYLAAKYQEEGITHFKWLTAKDERVREDHKKLHGKIFTFDNPPVVDSRTGAKGLPGEYYNCRCRLEPVVTSDWLENRRKIYNERHKFSFK